VAAGVGVVSGVYIFKPMVTDSDTSQEPNAQEAGKQLAEVRGIGPHVGRLQETKAQPSP